MTVLILDDGTDEHAQHVYRQLLTRGVRAEFLDSTQFPAQLTITYEPRTGDGTLRWVDGRQLRFDEIRAVYWRNHAGISTVALPDPEQAFIAQNDTRSLFDSILVRLPARWVNGYRAFHLHQMKPVALALVAELGIPIPDTLLSNDAEEVLRFVARHPACIFKPVQGGAFTERLTAAHLSAENLRNLMIAPVTIQEEVFGTDVRVFVAGDTVLACQVVTTALDFREDPDPRITAIELPGEVAQQCVRAARALDLVWTGIDLRRTPEGKYVFLEANPSPMFLGFEARSGLPLTQALLRLLLGE
jgi:glutathione synthase/RimK-type ligase-like ATP-grasp enzyme